LGDYSGVGAVTIKKTIIHIVVTGFSAGAVFVILLLHTAWGDERYVLKEEDRLDKIAFIDTQLLIKDQEIIFAESAVEKEKLRAIKAIYQRQKEALKEKPKE